MNIARQISSSPLVSVEFVGGTIMKRFFCTLLLIAPLLFLSCEKEDSPVSNQTPTPSPPKTIALYGYGSYIDSAYYKMWSDSSWEKFNQVTIINGTTYVTTINNNGDEYYYDALGYAGFNAKSQSLIIFDKPVTSLPDTLVFGQKYIRETTFFYQGYNYSLRYEQILQDTVSVSVPFGIFNPCLWFKSTSTLSAGGQSSVSTGQFWLAIGPADIKQTLNSGNTIIMIRGVVNGEGWGMSVSGKQMTLHKEDNSFFLGALVKPLSRM
jgi:hypothetical protein